MTEDLSSGSRARMLTQPGEPYEAAPDPDGVGMLGLFNTEFRVVWEGGARTHFGSFEEARDAVRDNRWSDAVQIDRIETIWVRSRDGG